MNGANDITAAQLRRARELLGWSEDDLALRANVDAESIRQFEAGRYPPSAEQRGAIRGAVVAAGVELTDGRIRTPGCVRTTMHRTRGSTPSELTTENDR